MSDEKRKCSVKCMEITPDSCLLMQRVVRAKKRSDCDACEHKSEPSKNNHADQPSAASGEPYVKPAGGRQLKGGECAKCERDMKIVARGLCGKCYKEEKDTGTIDERFPTKQSPAKKSTPLERLQDVRERGAAAIEVVDDDLIGQGQHDEREAPVEAEDGSRTIHLAFGNERDLKIYEALKEKADFTRRTPANWLLCFLEDALVKEKENRE